METRTDAENLRRTFQLLGFDGFQFSNANGYSGGIIVAWKGSIVDVEVLMRHFQFLHMRVTFKGGRDWYFTSIYASPQEEGRKVLWDELRNIANLMQGNWLLAGDFNDISHISEKKGGIPANQGRCDRFMDRMNACHLMDCGSIGSRFTWRGPIFRGGERIFERLDRALVNDNWRLAFPHAVVKVLARIDFSDHHPLLIYPFGIDNPRRLKHFKFESAWLLEDSFMDMLRASWKDYDNICNQLVDVAQEMGKWKHLSFDRVLGQKRELIARIGGIQRRVYEGCSNKYLQRLEYKLQRELEHILKQEELMWYQRSRARWLADGDRNTKYYHLKAVTRRRQNKVLMLRDADGSWVEDRDKLKELANNFYKSLFTTNDSADNWFQTALSYPELTAEEFQHIRRDIDDEEVRMAVFSMHPWKAPGPDGFPAGFYQKAWEIVGMSVCDFVKKVWANPLLLNDVNVTDICLIPKIDQPEFINQFRPISLCNTVYKIVSKVMTNRIKDSISKIISPNQTGFIPRRSIHENIIVAQEMAHSMCKMNGKVGFFVIKVDLSKAYDKLNWKFIHHVLQETGYPVEWINVVMASVTSVRTNVKWNGERAEYFAPQRGIRQGDPISPYLFVLCLDKLSHLISQAVHEGKWKPMKAGRSGPLISHLMFADDLLLFAQASEDQMREVMHILDIFCSMSGQEVSQEKTSIMFSKNVQQHTRDQLANISGFRVTQSMGKYLGVPLVGRAPRKSDYNYLLAQVKSKLSSWKAKQLSLAGRITLSKAIIEAIPIYPMMTANIPKSCLQQLQKMQRSFIWGEAENERRYHAVSWDTITLPKSLGGLGIRRLHNMNKACLMKLGWSMKRGDSALWIDVLKGKYAREHPNLDSIVAKNHDSSLWKSLSAMWKELDEFTVWSVGNGELVQAWKDRWIFVDKSIDELQVPVPENLNDMRVKDLVDEHGQWNYQMLQSWLPHTIVRRLWAILPPTDDNGMDQRGWKGDKNGEFSVSSAYLMICNFTENFDDTIWAKIWRITVAERIRSFIWLVKHNRILTNYRKSKMNLGGPWCNHCVDEIEDVLHILRDCPLAKAIWCNVLRMEVRTTFFNLQHQEWITFNITKELGKDHVTVPWNAFWATSCHMLWKWRNSEEHDATFMRPVQPWKEVYKWTTYYMNAMQNKVMHNSNSTASVCVSIAWKPPINGWVCLNTDGASKDNQ
ncbi:ribonuclease H, partial [Trifolium pratense]